MILYCAHCGQIWRYRGGKATEEPGTSCPGCHGYVPFGDRVDRPLPAAGEYGGAVYIGVDAEMCPVYYDRGHRLLIRFIGGPDPFSESREEPVTDLVEAVKEIGFRLGWRYRCSAAEIEEEVR